LGQGSLAELGFSVQRVVRNIMDGKQQFLVTLIDDKCEDMRKTPDERKDSDRGRALVKSKMIQNVSYPVITLVENLDQMLDISLVAYGILKQERYRTKDQAKSA
jgi:hypothetical protein